jgi:hypothetical protein
VYRGRGSSVVRTGGTGQRRASLAYLTGRIIANVHALMGPEVGGWRGSILGILGMASGCAEEESDFCENCSS